MINTIPRPGRYSWSHISYMQSPYHCWFQLMNYPELDIHETKSGEWAIIQYYNTPIIPAQTKWQVVLGYMKNIEISYSFCEKYAKQLDLQRKAFWAREEAATKAMLDEKDKLEEHKLDSVNRATKAIVKNEALMNRIAKNGLKEMDLSYIARHVPKSEYQKPIVRSAPDVSSASQPANETVHAGIPSKV